MPERRAPQMPPAHMRARRRGPPGPRIPRRVRPGLSPRARLGLRGIPPVLCAPCRILAGTPLPGVWENDTSILCGRESSRTSGPRAPFDVRDACNLPPRRRGVRGTGPRAAVPRVRGGPARFLRRSAAGSGAAPVSRTSDPIPSGPVTRHVPWTSPGRSGGHGQLYVPDLTSPARSPVPPALRRRPAGTAGAW